MALQQYRANLIRKQIDHCRTDVKHKYGLRAFFSETHNALPRKSLHLIIKANFVVKKQLVAKFRAVAQ